MFQQRLNFYQLAFKVGAEMVVRPIWSVSWTVPPLESLSTDWENEVIDLCGVTALNWLGQFFTFC